MENGRLGAVLARAPPPPVAGARRRSGSVELHSGALHWPERRRARPQESGHRPVAYYCSHQTALNLPTTELFRNLKDSDTALGTYTDKRVVQEKPSAPRHRGSGRPSHHGARTSCVRQPPRSETEAAGKKDTIRWGAARRRCRRLEVGAEERSAEKADAERLVQLLRVRLRDVPAVDIRDRLVDHERAGVSPVARATQNQPHNFLGRAPHSFAALSCVCKT